MRSGSLAHVDHALDKKHVLLLADSGVRSNSSAMGNWLQQQPLIVVFGGGGRTGGTGMRHEFRRRVQHVIPAKKPQKCLFSLCPLLSQ